jgi:hypothetical protein
MSVPTEIRGSLGEIGDADVSEARALSQHKTMPPTAGNTVEQQGSFRVADVYFAADDTTFWNAKIGGGRHGMAPKWSVDGFHRRVGARRTAGGRCKGLETEALRRVLVEALATRPDREREIILARKVVERPATLEGLGARYNVSKERIRQLRLRASSARPLV